MFMDSKNNQMQREIQELKSEVKFLKRILETVIFIICIGLVVIVPNLLFFGIALGLLIVFGFLVSRQRRMIFLWLFRDRKRHDHDA